MKKFLSVVLFAICFSCGDQAIQKPDNLIEEDKMIDVLYDLSILEAMKSQRSAELAKSGVDHTSYIYEKHKIDSVQFASSNKYYSSNPDKYKDIYEEVKKRIEKQKMQVDATNGLKPAAEKLDDTPRVQ